MAHAHAHHNHEGGSQQPERTQIRPLIIALSITTVFMIVEVIGGLLTNSLALLADAGHMATDAAALALAVFAMWLARRPATPERSFGFYRAEVLAALLNAATLILISLYIFWEVFERIGEPPEVQSGQMLAVAVAGLLANAAVLWVLTRSGGHEHNLNTRAAVLHVVGDFLGSVGAITAAVIMLLTGWYLADPLLSAGIGLLILWNSWRVLRESVDVLLEATPKHIDPEKIRTAMCNVEGVEDVHDLHVWTVTSGLIALSSHVEVADMRNWHLVLVNLGTLLRERFGIAHVTLQPETPEQLPEVFRGCSLDSPEAQRACLMPAGVNADQEEPSSLHGHQHD